MVAEGEGGISSEKDVWIGSAKLVSGSEGSILVATGWLAGLVGGVSIGWQCRCSILAASVVSSMVFVAGAGGGEGEGDVQCTCCRLVVEREGEGWLVDVEGGGRDDGRGRSLLFADWALSDCSSS